MAKNFLVKRETSDPDDCSRVLRQLKFLGLNQAEIATIIGLNYRTVSNYYVGRSKPSPAVLQKMKDYIARGKNEADSEKP